MPYFTTDELRSLPDLSDSSRFSDERLEDAHDWIVGIIERECETSFIPRVITEILDGRGRVGLTLAQRYALSVDAVSINGVVSPTPAATFLVRDGSLHYKSGARWSASALGNVEVTYTAGYSITPPPDLKQAALRAARNWLLTMDAWSGKDSRATSISNEYGNIELATAGEGAPTGIPDVDATIMAWKRKVAVADTATSNGRFRSVRVVSYGEL